MHGFESPAEHTGALQGLTAGVVLSLAGVSTPAGQLRGANLR